MKKQLLVWASLALVSSISAQTVVDFEELDLSNKEFYNGSDNAGKFISKGITFPTGYVEYSGVGYWSKFIYSKGTDSVTAGSTNAHSAYPTKGAKGSKQYGINNGGNIDFGSELVLSSFDVANTTYAFKSMLNGDSFGKKFGSTKNANGTEDGTKGEDFFRLVISGRNKDSVLTNSITVYLADYRFSDNSKDFILKEWKNIDLTSLGNIRYLQFKLESSDVGQYGMNTPNYFALDNLVFGKLDVNELTSNAVNVFPNPTNGNISIKTEKPGMISVVDLAGNCVVTTATEGFTNLDLTELNAGTYFVLYAAENQTLRTKIVKL